MPLRILTDSLAHQAAEGFFFDIGDQESIQSTLVKPLFDNFERGSGGGAPASVEGVLEKIQVKDYAGALAELETLPQDSSGQENLLFLKGECHYRLHEYSAAANAFQQILQSTSSILNRQKAEWYLLLTLLKGGKDKPEFQNLLKGILADPNHVFYYEAEKLKSRL